MLKVPWVDKPEKGFRGIARADHGFKGSVGAPLPHIPGPKGGTSQLGDQKKIQAIEEKETGGRQLHCNPRKFPKG